MAVFKYVGELTKPNGKVDVKVGEFHFVDVTPGSFEIEVPDGSKEEKYLEQSIDVFTGKALYEKKA